MIFSVGSFARAQASTKTSLSMTPRTVRSTHLCPQCEKDFPNLSSLSKHLTSHSQERPYECIVCTKRFKRFDHLTSHVLTHRGEKPFQCPASTCQKRYSDQRSLRRHFEKNHPQITIGQEGNFQGQQWNPLTDNAQPTNAESQWERASYCQQPMESAPGAQKSPRGFWSRLRKSTRPSHYKERARASLSPRQANGRPSQCPGEMQSLNQGSLRDDRWPIRCESAESCIGRDFNSSPQLTVGNGKMTSADRGELIWAPGTVADDSQIDDFVKFAGSMAAYGGGWTPDYALSVLHKHGGHIKTALGVLLMPMKKTKRKETDCVQRWSLEEKRNFELGFSELGKQFHLLHRYVRTKTTAQIIQYYYKWKKEEPDKYLHYKLNHKANQISSSQSSPSFGFEVCQIGDQSSPMEVANYGSPMESCAIGTLRYMPSCANHSSPRPCGPVGPITQYRTVLGVHT